MQWAESKCLYKASSVAVLAVIGCKKEGRMADNAEAELESVSDTSSSDNEEGALVSHR